MKAYMINDTELYFDHSPDKALARHLFITDGEGVTEWDIKEADPGIRWEDSDETMSTVGELLAKATEPNWMGSTER